MLKQCFRDSQGRPTSALVASSMQTWLKNVTHRLLWTQVASWHFDRHRPIAKPASQMASGVTIRWRIRHRDAVQKIALLSNGSRGWVRIARIRPLCSLQWSRCARSTQAELAPDQGGAPPPHSSGVLVDSAAAAAAATAVAPDRQPRARMVATSAASRRSAPQPPQHVGAASRRRHHCAVPPPMAPAPRQPFFWQPAVRLPRC